MPSQVPRKRMEEKSPRIIIKHLVSSKLIKIPALNMDDVKKHSNMVESPTSQAATMMRKSSSERWNCLCSPTKHAGSFRCRRHRSTSMHRSMSIDSRLSSMPSKDSPPQAQ
ncbi:uncharacterized protein LOC130732973 [Lotus japonicus]|uniref:Uncharacterized protein n=1 Tax=Lotus japonicus TaxID=34305 RepID=I3SS75_LOTJA|nr:uncharacterized protein LOC130732973 [Lotus japonicus]AFK43117.1 unknown [Lotus japonicus]